MPTARASAPLTDGERSALGSAVDALAAPDPVDRHLRPAAG
ncbi:hypothetical protein QWM81_12905 [Streptomyces ficellus]|uniref:Uncharacterized protein n=1 Tax=Streptomyces ficellus TaxID=1977088 RepID=A0ABT7Z607_9ACTN|nr:hypothetical protein [Streptomyces ficellus]MDN3294934.1 hypothetical protein [Streptomyces ficellus]